MAMNKYLEKAAALSEQRQFERYVATKPDYQSAWVNNINTGAELGAAAAIAPEVWKALRESKTQDELGLRVLEAPGQVWSKNKGRLAAAVGAGALAGTAYGALRHVPIAKAHYEMSKHIPGVHEYATGEVAPVVGRLAGASAGGGLAAMAAKGLKLGSKERLAAGLVGGFLGAKIGDKLVNAHNEALLNKLREKHY